MNKACRVSVRSMRNNSAKPCTAAVQIQNLSCNMSEHQIELACQKIIFLRLCYFGYQTNNTNFVLNITAHTAHSACFYNNSTSYIFFIVTEKRLASMDVCIKELIISLSQTLIFQSLYLCNQMS